MSFVSLVALLVAVFICISSVSMMLKTITNKRSVTHEDGPNQKDIVLRDGENGQLWIKHDKSRGTIYIVEGTTEKDVLQWSSIAIKPVVTFKPENFEEIQELVVTRPKSGYHKDGWKYKVTRRNNDVEEVTI